MMIAKKIKRLIKKMIWYARYPLLRRAYRRFYGQFVGAGKLFFDVGANIGQKSSLFRTLGVGVVAIEPQHHCLEILKKKFSIDHNVVIVPEALGAEKGETMISICEEADAISSCSPRWIQEGRFKDFTFDRQEKVSVTTLDALIERYGMPDFCKIDVEGFEVPVLQGLTKKIPALNVEFAAEFFDQTQIVVERLMTLGFTKFNYTLGETLAFAEVQWLTGEDLLSVLKKRGEEDKDLWGDLYAK